MPVSVMKSVLTRSEYLKWLQYNKYKSPEIAEIQMSILMSMISRGLGSKKAKPEDFMISKVAEERPLDKPLSMDEVGAFFGALSQPL